MWQPPLYKLYPTMTPPTPEYVIIEGHLIYNVYTNIY